jgi:hypothetical protein
MILTVEVMKQIIEKLPDDYEIWYNNNPVQDKVEIDVSEKKIILKS